MTAPIIKENKNIIKNTMIPVETIFIHLNFILSVKDIRAPNPASMEIFVPVLRIVWLPTLHDIKLNILKAVPVNIR